MEPILNRVVKEFGNGAHVTLPSEWIGSEVEVELITPDVPEQLAGIEEGSNVTVTLSNGGTIHGVVDSVGLHDFIDGSSSYEVVCELDESKGNTSDYIDSIPQIDMADITQFELIANKTEFEPWIDDVEVAFYEGDPPERVSSMTPTTVEELTFTLSRTLS